MAAKAAILFLVCLFNLSSGYKLMDDDYDENVTDVYLPTEYNIKVERIDLISDFKVPMEIWYSSEYNRSRVDVYGGMVKRFFYWGEDGPAAGGGIVFMTMPKWTEKEGSSILCSKLAEEDETSFPRDVFPSEQEYVYTGQTLHEGRKVNVWKYSEDIIDTRIEYVMYGYRTERLEDIPVQIEYKSMDLMLGSITEHVIFNYDHFNPLFCEDELDVNKDFPEEFCEEYSDFGEHVQLLHPSLHGHLDLAFNSFKKHHKREYKNKKEHDMRKDVFHKNWQYIVNQNSKNLGYKLALNHLSDLTSAERARMNGGRQSSKPSGSLTFPHSGKEIEDIITQIPEEYDMRLEGIISPIKNQDRCGSCWAFGTTAAVEGALARLDGRLLDLSEQSILDCDWEGNNEGCNGGHIKDAFNYVLKHGIPLEDDYGGYLDENGYCHLENVTQVFKIRGFTMVTPLSASATKVALYKYGPLAVSMQCNDDFSFYKSGVFYDHTCVEDQTNHVVALVGYGTRDGAEYWIVKNSYGQQWGEDGYMLLSSLNNNCFVLNAPYYAVV